MATVHSIRARVFIDNLSNDICCPFFDASDNLHYLSQDSGDVFCVNQANGSDKVHCTNGQPNAAVFHSNGTLYISDFAHGAVLAVPPDGDQDLVVGVYEDKPFKGPSSITTDNDGNLYFTDSGPFGETGLHNPTGSLFAITNSTSGQILKPLSLENLASPTGVALSPNGKYIYVAEQMNNRILRYIQKPEGVYHGSVFYHLNGGIGPASIVCDKNGNIYVAQLDSKDSVSDGKVHVISSSGELISNILVGGPELSGIAVNRNFLYISEKSTGTIYKTELVRG